MSRTLRHRGPDDEGVWVDEQAGVALGHRRLSVIDLSPLGHQPMCSRSGRLVLTFNGELYNHRELRRQLESAGHRFRGRADTEVVVEAFDAWGFEPSLRRFNGMFALAVWDRSTRRLQLARDRMGEKPLYWGWAGGSLVFASELKAIRANPDFVPAVDPGALGAYLRYGCVPAPHCIYRDAGKLLPGHAASLGAADLETRQVPARPYWSAADAVTSARVSTVPVSPEERRERLLELLDDAVRLRLDADVPVGALLSGGIDSTLVTAVAQRHAPRVRTFTVGFDDRAYDESLDAAAVARHLGTDHTAVTMSAAEGLGVVPRLAQLYDEPFADPSQVPSVLVAEVARRDVTVVLSGDGGDELFAGYNRHAWVERLLRTVGPVPALGRRALAGALTAVRPGTVERWSDRLARVAPALAVRNPAIKAAKLAAVLDLDTPVEAYRRLVSQWPEPEALSTAGVEAATIVDRPDGWPVLASPVEQMMYLDMATYLPDDILTKVDRATMSVALEARVPLLDPRIVDYAWSLPLQDKLRANTSKWALRDLLDQFVPRQLVDRPKMGFGVPIGRWLRHELRDWAEELLAPTCLADHGLRPEPVRALWARHASGEADASSELWVVLMYQQWVAQWTPTSTPGWT